MTDNLPVARQPQQPAVALDQVTDLDQALRLCDVIAQASLVPGALQRNPANILLVIMMGRDIGLKWPQALREIYCPPGGMPQMRGRLLLARLREAGHDYWWDEGEDYCEFHITRGDSKREYTARFSLADAQAAGLVQEKDGRYLALSRDGRPLPWQTYRPDMLFWRAVARGVNRVAPEVAMGFEVMEAAPAPDSASPVPPAARGGTVPAPASAGTAAPAPSEDNAEPGPSGEQVAAELAAMDEQYQAWRPATDPEHAPGGAASREEQRQLADAFAAMGWQPRKHKATILDACSAFCGRPVLRSEDLRSAEVADMIAEMEVLRTKGPDEALPVLLADKAEEWRQRLRERDPDAAQALFG